MWNDRPRSFSLYRDRVHRPPGTRNVFLLLRIVSKMFRRIWSKSALWLKLGLSHISTAIIRINASIIRIRHPHLLQHASGNGYNGTGWTVLVPVSGQLVNVAGNNVATELPHLEDRVANYLFLGRNLALFATAIVVLAGTLHHCWMPGENTFN